ncbi:MAG: FecR domain-containing protein [Terriglobia bacterium]
MKDKSRSLLDEALDEIRGEKIEPDAIEQASQRVWARLSGGGSSSPAPSPVGATGGPIRGCAGFQTLIPSYLAGALPAARALLFEDHTRGCVACRRALNDARQVGGRRRTPSVALTRPRPRPKLKLGWAVGVVAAAVVALLLIGAAETGLRWRGGPRATVESVNGALYAISNQNISPLAPGARIQARDEIRTGPGSTAAVRLANGSLVEMSERADLSISKGWRRTTIRLAQGSIIVQASRKDSGHLSVATRDCTVSDRGTIFAVTQGVKGARISVIQGEVRVRQRGRSQTVSAGGQISTQPGLAKIPIREQIAWSPDAAHYLALVSEFSKIESQLEAMPGPAPRYASQLINYVPPDTVIYAAIPNLQSTLSEASQLFQERIAASPVLQQWWQKQEASGAAPMAEEILGKVQTFSEYLGNEVVIAVGRGRRPGDYSPVVLAQVEKPGLRAFLNEQLSVLNLRGKGQFRIVDHPALASLAAGNKPAALILLKNNMIVIATDPTQLRQVASLIGSGRASGFTATPFYAAIHQVYQGGASWLFCANLEQIVAGSVSKNMGVRPVDAGVAGLGNVKYLFVENKSRSGKPQNRVALTFSGERQGVASWLAAPSPMGTLDFVSPQASAALSFVLKDPKALIEGLLDSAQGRDGGFKKGLEEFESETGVDVVNDLAASLGGEVTVALDGPVLPSPQWEAALDVYNPQRLQASLAKLVTAFNLKLSGAAGTLRLTQEESGGRVLYSLRFDRVNAGAPSTPLPTIHYAFADGYMVVASSRSQLERAMQNHENGYSLAHSAEFQSHLPEGGNAYFSALFYENLGEKLGPLIQQLESSNAVTPGEKSSIADLNKNLTPNIIGAYGEPDRITLVSSGGLFGYGFKSLLTVMGLAHSTSHRTRGFSL